jgi:radical SAM/Cys-rich protein
VSRSLPIAAAATWTSIHFDKKLAEHGLELRATSVDTLQVNVGKLCNQACKHCHVDAGPARTEIMTRETAEAVVAAIDRFRFAAVDITGGAPELNPSFRYLVAEAVALGSHVIVRHNLTVTFEPGQEDLPELFRRNRVELVCSLPCYLEENTDKQRGHGVFAKSIEALRRLNAVGYGRDGSGLVLNLVYNPVGAYLPPSQAALEADYKRELATRYGVTFDRLYTITNMPISRFLDWLVESGNLEDYLALLVRSFNPSAARGVMCRTTLSVGWNGRLYDCDFNQMLDLELGFGAPAQLASFDLAALATRRIRTARHCFGCTAGAGSSCGGAIA